VSVDPRGAPCACGGRGCLETVAGRDAVFARAVVPAAGPRGGTPALVARATDGDPEALAALGEAGQALGVALAAAVNLVDPQAVVLGGHFGPLVPWLRPPVQHELARRVLASARGGCEIRASALGEDAAARGAAAGVLRDVMADPGAFGDRAAARATGLTL
jgi:predicted NBD/HSP70 family sugar kinase